MDIDKAVKFVEKQIEELERSTYVFTTVVKPRYEADVKILNTLKEQCFKMKVLQEKAASGEEATQQEIYEAVPIEFR